MEGKPHKLSFKKLQAIGCSVTFENHCSNLRAEHQDSVALPHSLKYAVSLGFIHHSYLWRVQLCATPWAVPARLLHPWDSPGKNTGVGCTGVGCHFLLQGIFPTQGSNPGFLHGRQILYPLNHQGRPGTHSTKFFFDVRAPKTGFPSRQQFTSRIQPNLQSPNVQHLFWNTSQPSS